MWNFVIQVIIALDLRVNFRKQWNSGPIVKILARMTISSLGAMHCKLFMLLVNGMGVGGYHFGKTWTPTILFQDYSKICKVFKTHSPLLPRKQQDTLAPPRSNKTHSPSLGSSHSCFATSSTPTCIPNHLFVPNVDMVILQLRYFWCIVVLSFLPIIPLIQHFLGPGIDLNVLLLCCLI